MADKNQLRAELVDRLMSDRAQALRERNAGAAVQASARVVDLMRGRLAEDDAKDVSPIGRIVHEIVHVSLCLCCRQKLGLDPASPLAPLTAAERSRISGWDEPEIDPDAAAAEPAPPATGKSGKPATIEVPKSAEALLRRRRRENGGTPPVRGIV